MAKAVDVDKITKQEIQQIIDERASLEERVVAVEKRLTDALQERNDAVAARFAMMVQVQKSEEWYNNTVEVYDKELRDRTEKHNAEIEAAAKQVFATQQAHDLAAQQLQETVVAAGGVDAVQQLQKQRKRAAREAALAKAQAELAKLDTEPISEEGV